MPNAPTLSDVNGIGGRRLKLLDEQGVDDIPEFLKLTQAQVVEILSVTDEAAAAMLEHARVLSNMM